LRHASHTFFGYFLAAFCGLLVSSGVSQAETHWNLQAVNESGVSSWAGSYPFSVVGVLLTDPSEMLDSTPDFIPYGGSSDMFKMGGEWQVTVQAALSGDRLGTTCWMGQNYGNHPAHLGEEFSYTNEAWAAEVERLNHDPATGHAFQKGDLVMVTANRSLFYGGKRNINEAHSIDPAADFTISLVISNYGLPAPEVISLASIMRPDDGNATTHEDVFDATRATGAEHWQGMRVRLVGLTLMTTDGWSATNAWSARKCTVTDGEGRFFTLRHPRFSLGAAPTNRFDAIGVFTQESGSGTDGTFGYELFVQEIAPADEPLVTIAKQPVVSWPGSLTNYRLESTDSLTATNWVPVTNSAVMVDGRNTVILEADAAHKFFRLERVQ
jgi:hypothetical protein